MKIIILSQTLGKFKQARANCPGLSQIKNPITMNERMELIQTAKSHVSQIAKVSKEVGKDSDVEKVVCYFGENGQFIVKRRENGWTVSNEITMPPNATVKQVANHLKKLEEQQ